MLLLENLINYVLPPFMQVYVAIVVSAGDDVGVGLPLPLQATCSPIIAEVGFPTFMHIVV